MGFERALAKQNVRQAMKLTRPSPVLTTLLYTVVVSVVSGMINGILGTLLALGSVGSFSELYLRYLQMGYEIDEAMEEAMLSFLSQGPGAVFTAIVGGMVLSVVVAIWQSVMRVGYSGYALSMVRGENPKMEKIFCAFPQIGPVLVTKILYGLFVFLWTLLLSAAYFAVIMVAAFAAAAIDAMALMVLVMLVDTVLYVIGVIWVTLRYELVDYVLLDKGLSGMDAINESKRLMRGRVKDAFVLQLSFFGWYLLMCLIIYIGIFVVVLIAVAQMAAAGYSEAVLIRSAVLALGVVAVAVIGALALSLWLQPYVSGCMAKFYDWAKACADGHVPGPGSWGGPSGPNVPGGYGPGGAGGYHWTPGPGSGSGTGAGGLPPQPPQPPKPPAPKDDPWN